MHEKVHTRRYISTLFSRGSSRIHVVHLHVREGRHTSNAWVFFSTQPITSHLKCTKIMKEVMISMYSNVCIINSTHSVKPGTKGGKWVVQMQPEFCPCLHYQKGNSVQLFYHVSLKVWPNNSLYLDCSCFFCWIN